MSKTKDSRFRANAEAVEKLEKSVQEKTLELKSLKKLKNEIQDNFRELQVEHDYLKDIFYKDQHDKFAEMMIKDMYHDLLLEKQEAENINKIAQINVLRDDLKRCQFQILTLHDERESISKYADEKNFLADNLRYQLSQANYLEELHTSEAQVWKRRFHQTDTLLKQKEEEFHKFKNRYSHQESKLKDKDTEISKFQGRIKALKDSFDKQITGQERDKKVQEQQQNNLVDRYDILKELIKKVKQENVDLRIKTSDVGLATEKVQGEKPVKKLHGNLSFVEESNRQSDSMYEQQTLLDKLTQLLLFSERDIKFLQTKADVPNFLENQITDKIKIFVREHDQINKLEIDNMNFKNEINSLKDNFFQERHQLVNELSQLNSIVEDMKTKDETVQRFKNYEMENTDLKEKVEDQGRKIFSLKQTIGRYRTMNKKIREEMETKDENINMVQVNPTEKKPIDNENINQGKDGNQKLNQDNINDNFNLKIQSKDTNLGLSKISIAESDYFIADSRKDKLKDSNFDSNMIEDSAKLDTNFFKRSITPNIIRDLKSTGNSRQSNLPLIRNIIYEQKKQSTSLKEKPNQAKSVKSDMKAASKYQEKAKQESIITKQSKKQ